MATIFSKIISGKIPCNKIMEDDKFLAFLDINPVKPGHTLVIPKKEIDYIFDLDDSLLSELMIFSKKVAKLLELEISCKKIGIMVCGLEVPHTHIHLIPIDDIADLNFKNAKPADLNSLYELSLKITKHS